MIQKLLPHKRTCSNAGTKESTINEAQLVRVLKDKHFMNTTRQDSYDIVQQLQIGNEKKIEN